MGLLNNGIGREVDMNDILPVNLFRRAPAK